MVIMSKVKSFTLPQSPVHCEATFHIVDYPEVLPRLVDLDDVHEAGGELGIGPGLPVDLDQPLLHDRLHLFHAQCILHPIPANSIFSFILPLLESWQNSVTNVSVNQILSSKASFISLNRDRLKPKRCSSQFTTEAEGWRGLPEKEADRKTFALLVRS